MTNVKMDELNILGIEVRTSNLNGQSAQDIGVLWAKFQGEGIFDKIPNKKDFNVYSVYTKYEGNHLEPYTTILGCNVSNLDNIPEGMTYTTIDAAKYAKFNSAGDLTKGIVYETWNEIWSSPLDRSYIADFEVYGEKAMDINNAEVEIFVGLNN